jgi:hypothetical protein
MTEMTYNKQLLAERDYYRELARLAEEALAGRNKMPAVYSQAMAGIEALKVQNPPYFKSKRKEALNQLNEGLALIKNAIADLERI